MKMCDGHDRRLFGFRCEEHPERKSVNNRAPKRARDHGKLERSFFDSDKRDAKCLKKLGTEPVALAFVPQHCFKRVEFCFRPDLQTSHLPSVVKTVLEPFDDLLPRPGLLRCSTMRCKPFLENGLLPFVTWYLIHAGGDVIPERLDIVDLIFNGKIVESWRRQG